MSDEINSERQRAGDILEALGNPEFQAEGIILFDQNDRTGDAAFPKAREAHFQNLLTHTLAAVLRSDGKVVNQAAAAVVATKGGADNSPPFDSSVAQTRVAVQIESKRFLVVPLRHFYAVATPPKCEHLVIVERGKRTEFDFSLHIPIGAYTYYGMDVGSLKENLRQHPAKNVRFVLPDGDSIPADFHVTEVGHVVKSFVDCGGTVRRLETCLLQAWVAGNDSDHRLTAEKLGKILELSTKVVPSDDLEVEVEYEPCAVAQYRLESAEAAGAELRFQLAHKHTDCLAREACGLAPTGSGCRSGEADGKCC